mgnify:CR=1
MKELREKMLHSRNDFYKVSDFNIQRKAQSQRRKWMMNTIIIRRFAIIFERSLQHEKLKEMMGNQNLRTKTTIKKKIKMTNKRRTILMSNTKRNRRVKRSKKKIKKSKTK